MRNLDPNSFLVITLSRTRSRVPRLSLIIPTTPDPRCPCTISAPTSRRRSTLIVSSLPPRIPSSAVTCPRSWSCICCWSWGAVSAVPRRTTSTWGRCTHRSRRRCGIEAWCRSREEATSWGRSGIVWCCGRGTKIWRCSIKGRGGGGARGACAAIT